jgi:hypothetical protein
MTKIYLVAGLAAVLFFGGCNFGGETQEEAPEETVEETTREETTETTVEEEDEETVVVEVEQPPPDLELDTPQPDPQSRPRLPRTTLPSSPPRSATKIAASATNPCPASRPSARWRRCGDPNRLSGRSHRPTHQRSRQKTVGSWLNGRQTGTVLGHRRGFRARWTTQPDEPHREEGSGRDTTAGTKL